MKTTNIKTVTKTKNKPTQATNHKKQVLTLISAKTIFQL